jgi:histone H3/H4
MNDDLLLRANAVKKAVATGNETFIATKSAYEVNKKTLDETLAGLKEKFGISSYEELQKALEELGAKIAADLENIEELLDAAGLSVTSAEEASA